MTAALAEWHVVSEAIARGDQVVTIRSGAVDESSFWLYPGWARQSEAGIKRSWHGELSRSNRERRSDHRVPVRCHCRVEGWWEVTDQRRLEAIDAAHLWRDLHAPATVILVRASALVEPFLATGGEARDGWVELAEEPPSDALVPSLTDEAFALHAARIRGAL